MVIRNWKKELFTIPNLFSAFRLLLIPVYMYIYLNASKPTHYYVAAAILAVSCLTDMIDGKIARKFNMISTFGKFLDPLADKATQFTLIVCLAIRYPVLWYLVGLFFVKEVFQLVAAAVSFRKGKMLNGALISGKVCTTILFVSLILMIMFPSFSETTVTVIACVDAVFIIIAFIEYFLAYYGKNKKIYDFKIEKD